MVEKKVVIQHQARLQLWKAYKYIQKDSYQNAEKVRTKILTSIKALSKTAEQFKLDKYCLENDGSIRAYEIYKYRISFQITDTEIVVLRIRHTKMNPLKFTVK
jgi:plasmid stabilization system protein ParE